MIVASPPSGATLPRPYLSVIVPLLNEEENLRELHSELTAVLVTLGREYEVIYVDDGSRDAGFSILEAIAAGDARVRVVKFRKNYGQTAAMAAGIDYARGEIIIPIDADRQNDPLDIPRLLAKLDDGYDVVSGWRKSRKDTFVTRRIPSIAANYLISAVTGVRLHDYGCSLKAYRAEYLKPVRLYGEMHRFIPALASLEGARVTELAVNHFPRRAGISKYGLTRILKVFLDLLVVKFLGDYTARPIHFFGTMGVALCGAGTLAGLATLYQKIAQGAYAHRNPLLLLAVFLFLLGVQFIVMGLLAELIIRTYHESQSKKTYSVAKTVNLNERL